MKNFALLPLFALLSLSAFAQGTAIALNITIVDANNMAVPNHQVTLVDSSFMGSWYVLQTSANGTINTTVTIPTPPLGTVKHLYLLTSDNCNNTYSADTILTSNTLQFAWSTNFVICSQSTPNNCNHTITNTPLGQLTYAFSSSYVGGPNSSYLWSFGDGTTATGPTPTHTYAAPGLYYYCLTVDSCQQICDSLSMSPNAPCDASFNLSATGWWVQIFPAALGQPGTFYFNWGDGTIDTVSSAAMPLIPYNHMYAAAGNYQLCVTHTDTSCSATQCINLSFAPQLACNASYIIDTVNSQPGVVYLWNTSTVTLPNPATAQVNYFWTFGDGAASNQPFPTHAYTSPGTYAVCLTIVATDSSLISCVSTFCDTLTVDQNGNIIYKGAILGWTLVVLNPASIGINENVLANTKIYPNPASDLLTIDLPDGQTATEAQIFSTNGTLVRRLSLVAGQNSVDVATLPPGMYIVQLQSNKAMAQQKFIKN